MDCTLRIALRVGPSLNSGRSLNRFERERYSLPATDAQRDNSALDAVALHRMQKSRCEHSPGRTNRMTMRNGIADRVLKATDHELEEQTRLRKTEDFKEGVNAVSKRRMPNFKGR